MKPVAPLPPSPPAVTADFASPGGVPPATPVTPPTPPGPPPPPPLAQPCSISRWLIPLNVIACILVVVGFVLLAAGFLRSSGPGESVAGLSPEDKAALAQLHQDLAQNQSTLANLQNQLRQLPAASAGTAGGDPPHNIVVTTPDGTRYVGPDQSKWYEHAPKKKQLPGDAAAPDPNGEQKKQLQAEVDQVQGQINALQVRIDLLTGHTGTPGSSSAPAGGGAVPMRMGGAALVLVGLAGFAGSRAFRRGAKVPAPIHSAAGVPPPPVPSPGPTAGVTPAPNRIPVPQFPPTPVTIQKNHGHGEVTWPTEGGNAPGGGAKIGAPATETDDFVPNIPDYQLLKLVGEGGYGQVWLAKDIFGNYRAVKVVRRNSFKDNRPFDREFEGVKLFEKVSHGHSGLVRILHAGMSPANDWFFYVMEPADDLYAGLEIKPERYQPKTLASLWNQRGGHLTPQECVVWGTEMCQALSYLHKCGLIHRDIKPPNIIFVGGHPKLADAGLVADAMHRKTIVGTEGYMAPEGVGSSQADIFSLGRLLGHLAFGPDAVPPVGAEPGDEWIDLRKVIAKASSLQAADRYDSAEQMGSALEDLGKRWRS